MWWIKDSHDVHRLIKRFVSIDRSIDCNIVIIAASRSKCKPILLSLRHDATRFSIPPNLVQPLGTHLTLTRVQSVLWDLLTIHAVKSVSVKHIIHSKKIVGPTSLISIRFLAQNQDHFLLLYYPRNMYSPLLSCLANSDTFAPQLVLEYQRISTKLACRIDKMDSWRAMHMTWS